MGYEWVAAVNFTKVTESIASIFNLTIAMAWIISRNIPIISRQSLKDRIIN